MTTLIYWFRNDLRLHDNPAFTQACANATRILPVYCHAPQSMTRWGFARVGQHREEERADHRAERRATPASQRRAAYDDGSDDVHLESHRHVSLGRGQPPRHEDPR